MTTMRCCGMASWSTTALLAWLREARDERHHWPRAVPLAEASQPEARDELVRRLDVPGARSRDAGRAEVSLGEAMRLWAKVGFLSFGGAAGQIAMLHRFVVDERRWLDERALPRRAEFLHAPARAGGAAARHLSRLAYARRPRRARRRRPLRRPGRAVMLALSLLYTLGSGLAVVDGLFLGIKAAVLAIVAEALMRIGRRALKTRALVLLAVATFLALVVLDLPFPSSSSARR